MGTTFTTFDILFFVLTFIFVVSAFFRGFIKEIFSFFNWIISLTLAYFLAPFASDILDPYFSNRLVLEGLTRSVIFIIVFITIAMTTTNMRESVAERVPNLFDKSLGILFGFIKTLIIFGAVYSVYLNIYGVVMKDEEVEDPSWFKESKSYSMIKFSGEMVNPLVKAFFSGIADDFDKVLPKKELDEKIEEVAGEEEDSGIAEPEIKLKEIEIPSSETGYNKKDIEKMNHLIDIIEKK